MNLKKTIEELTKIYEAYKDDERINDIEVYISYPTDTYASTEKIDDIVVFNDYGVLGVILYADKRIWEDLNES